jgi:hypothetical protein
MHLLVFWIFPSKPDFHLHKCEKIILPTHPCLRPAIYLFLRNLPPTQLHGPTQLFGRLEYFCMTVYQKDKIW